MKKILAVMKARQKEFYRDRSSMGWNFLFPFLVVFGFAFAFSNGNQKLYKVGLLGDIRKDFQSLTFLKTKYIDFVEVQNEAKSVQKLRVHKFDLLLVKKGDEVQYWTNKSSPKGYFLEKILRGDLKEDQLIFKRKEVDGKEIRYVDWLIPGVLSMNMMFSSLFGVGYVIVRYRKNGVLRRLKATPLRPHEFLLAQVFARLVILMVVFLIVFFGCTLAVNFKMEGSYAELFFTFLMGGLCLTSCGLMVASRIQSEEFAGGVLNLLSWPMMFLSGVWFSLEGAHPVIIKISKFLPLTHMIDGVRAIMNEGATLGDIAPQLLTLAFMTVLFLFIGSRSFRWD